MFLVGVIQLFKILTKHCLRCSRKGILGDCVQLGGWWSPARGKSREKRRDHEWQWRLGGGGICSGRMERRDANQHWKDNGALSRLRCQQQQRCSITGRETLHLLLPCSLDACLQICTAWPRLRLWWQCLLRLKLQGQQRKHVYERNNEGMVLVQAWVAQKLLKWNV